MGCAGLVEECSPGEDTCISVCNGLSLMLIVVSGGFGAYTWRSYKHPVAGMVAAFTPVITGLGTYPFVGIIIGIVMFALLISKNMRSAEQVI
jgi:hypothetical protein